jgi:hypothetical protein
MLVAGDFGATIPAKIAKYSIQYVSGTSVITTQPVKYF